MIDSPLRLSLAVAAISSVLCGCGGVGGNGGNAGSALPLLVGHSIALPSPPQVRRTRRRSSSSPISHVVIIVQENRSFNDLFEGFPGATTASSGELSNGQTVALAQIGLATTWDLEHDADGFFAACNGTGSIPGTDCKNNGFNKEYASCGSQCPTKYPEYSYVPHNETKPLFALAKRYVLADQMYASNFDASSFISHQYIIAAQAEASVNYPFGPWGCEGGSGDEIDTVGPDRQIPEGYQEPCYSDTSLGEEADSAGLSWAFYTSMINASDGSGIWSGYQANQYVYYGNDWKNDIITPQTQFFKDVKKGNLRDINWVTPTGANSDHAGWDSDTGPSWVASLVNAIGESPYWKNTAIFIFWDDYGGWYDPEPPGYVDYDGLGMRIPMLIVSAYAKKHVTHVQYEHGSILKFVEDTFGLPRLSASDKRANSPSQEFNFSAPPHSFKKIPAPYSRWFFLHQPPDLRMPDYE
jgi:phospholipase C